MSVERQRGFALLVVLWSVAFLAFLMTRLGAAARLEVQLAGNERAAAALQARTDGAVQVAAFHLLDRGAAHWAPGAVERRADQPGAEIGVRITDESGKLNLNRASPAALSGLVAAVGGPAAVGAEIAAWRGNGTAAENAATDARYAAAGLPYRPSHAAFRDAEALRLVLGMTPGLFARLAPHVTVFSTYGPGPDTADPVVARVVGDLGAAAAAQGGDYEPVDTVLVDVAATGGGGTHAERHAVLRLDPNTQPGERVLEWR